MTFQTILHGIALGTYYLLFKKTKKKAKKTWLFLSFQSTPPKVWHLLQTSTHTHIRSSGPPTV